METPEDLVTGPQVHEDCCDNQNPYVEVLPDTHEVVSHSSIPFQITQSQKKRRKFIPFKYHSKIFKKSKKNKDRNESEMSIFQGADPHKHGARHAIEDNRVSTTSSSYESCRPHKNNVSCHTYVDIEECFEHRDMDIERCNSISTVSTLPVITSRQRCGVDDHAGRQVVYREEQPSVNMTPKINYEMKVPDKSKGMRKYMLLFCIVLVSIVVSTVVAGYVGTEKVVKDIPNTVQNNFQTMPEWKTLGEQTNLTVVESLLNNGLSNFSTKLKALNEQHFQNLTSDLDLNFDLLKDETKRQNQKIQQHILNETDRNFDLLKNETKIQSQMIQQRILNETVSKEEARKNLNTMLDLTLSKEEARKNLNTMLDLTHRNFDLLKNETKIQNQMIQQRILNETVSKEEARKNLNTMLDLTQSNTDEVKNETKMLHELITQRIMNETAFKDDIKRMLFTIIHASICVRDCTDKIDGDYQSCYTCEGFITCSNDVLVPKNCSESYPDRPVYWDNIKQKCLFKSRTCDQKYTFDD
ncbi:uncharacterized protein LOC128171091 isoform X2 [Crassostrea angulata]|uniref:uncharacterized protein LOC128171091 isoform X2 n=1 Tax=Magallana angulata TaxID=2784310 RepID=UPI0022B129C1|nr:uncharacterized protein LOC128171091 isoform X2 [Crassostrea angulata]